MKVCKNIKISVCFDKWMTMVLFLMTITTYSLLAAQSKPQTNSVSITNAAPPQPIVVEIPQSVFIWNPKEAGYGRDPFFPVEPTSVKNTEQIPTGTDIKAQEEKKPQPPPKPVINLKLQGVIGNLKCIINGKQISVGDKEIIPHSNGKIRIKCNKINGDIVYITIIYNDGTTEDRELSMNAKK